MQSAVASTSHSLTLEIDVIPAQIDPTCIADFAGKLVAAFTGRTLLRATQCGRAVRADILGGAEPREGGRVWRLLADRAAIWSNGRRLTIEDVARGLTRAQAQRGGPLGWLAAVIANVRRAGADAIDVELTRPLACFPAMLTAEIFGPVAAPPHKGMTEAAGCYSFVGSLAQRAFALRRNEVGHHVWPDGPDEMIFVVTDTPAQGVRLFERGMIDVTCNPNLPAHALARYAGSPALRRRDLQLAGVLMFAAERLRSADALPLRRAVAQAIRRDRIAAALPATVEPLHRLTELWGGRDASAADETAELRAVVYPDPLVLGYADFEPNGTVVAHIAEDLRARAGLRVETLPLDYRGYLDCLARPHVDLLYALVQPAYPDPTSFLAAFRAGATDPARPDFDAALTEAETLFDWEDRLAACVRAERIMHEAMPLVPVVRAVTKCLVSDRAATLELGPDGIFRPPYAQRGPDA